MCHTKAKEERSLWDRLHKSSDWSRAVKAVARLKRREEEAEFVQEEAFSDEMKLETKERSYQD